MQRHRMAPTAIGLSTLLALAACGPAASNSADSAGLPSQSAEAEETQGSAPSGEPSTTRPTSEAPPPVTEWTREELYLLAGVHGGVRGICTPQHGEAPAGAIAALTCRPETAPVAEIGFFLFANDGEARTAYQARLAQYGVELGVVAGGGECESGEPSEGAELPSIDDVSAPRMGCFLNEFGVANLRLLTPPFVYIGVLGIDGDIAALDDWARGGPATIGAIPRAAVLWSPPEPFQP